MKRLKAVLVDDEPLICGELKCLLEEQGWAWVVGVYHDGPSALAFLEAEGADLVFLDVDMPGMDGLEVARRLLSLPKPPRVVFVTAHASFALEAFSVKAVDYLLKPFAKDRFDAALDKARRALGARPVPDLAPTLQTAAREGRPLDRIVVKDGAKVTLVPLDKLDYVQAQDDYVLLRTEGRDLLKQQTLSSLETQLDGSRFIRIHRSYILNLDSLSRLEQDSKEHWEALLRDGTRLPVSKTGYQRLRPLWSR